MKRLMMVTFAMTLPLIPLMKNDVSAQVPREEVDDRYKWSLVEMYPSDDAWEAEKLTLVDELKMIEGFKETPKDQPKEKTNANPSKTDDRIFEFAQRLKSMKTKTKNK